MGGLGGFDQGHIYLLKFIAGRLCQYLRELDGEIAEIEVLELLPDPALFPADHHLDSDCLERAGDGNEEPLFYQVLFLDQHLLALVLQTVRPYVYLQDVPLTLVDVLNEEPVDHQEYLPNGVKHPFELLLNR